jgi:RNA polymerase sigma factor (sigma-70 family)
LDDPKVPSEHWDVPAGEEAAGSEESTFPGMLLELLGLGRDAPSEVVWDAFLASYGDLLMKTAAYAYRGHDASMDAYAFILEKLRQDQCRRLKRFDGGDREAFRRWLVVVARRLCTDLRRQRYGRARQATSDKDLRVRKTLADELWDPKKPVDLPAGQASNPEWDLRFREQQGALDSALQALESKDRLLLAYRFEDGFSARRISEVMGFPTPFHVYRRLNRVLTILRGHLEDRGVEEPDP